MDTSSFEYIGDLTKAGFKIKTTKSFFPSYYFIPINMAFKGLIKVIKRTDEIVFSNQHISAFFELDELQIISILNEYIKSENLIFNNARLLPASYIDDLSSKTSCSRKHILIVEDDINVAEIFKRFINSAYNDMIIHHLTNPKEGISLFKEYRHFLMDINMPEMRGVEVFNDIKNLCDKHLLEEPYTIFCSAFELNQAVSDIVKQNPKCVLLAKPVTGTLLINTIKKYRNN